MDASTKGRGIYTSLGPFVLPDAVSGSGVTAATQPTPGLTPLDHSCCRQANYGCQPQGPYGQHQDAHNSYRNVSGPLVFEKAVFPAETKVFRIVMAGAQPPRPHSQPNHLLLLRYRWPVLATCFALVNANHSTGIMCIKHENGFEKREKNIKEYLWKSERPLLTATMGQQGHLAHIIVCIRILG